ncbi:TRAUB-domain-containing protein [Xylariomycetidae sp. FL2044]|nr:TRAUB-domain-containing protein [Xylariomycetidae sp. FL2044]
MARSEDRPDWEDRPVKGNKSHRPRFFPLHWCVVTKPPSDYDPEAEPQESDESGSEDNADANAGTEHYASVGKSKIRRKHPVALGPEYRGARVSREALDEQESESSHSESSNYEDAREQFDDPEDADLEADDDARDNDAEIESDNAFDQSDEEKFKDFVFRGSSQPTSKKEKRVKRPSAADFMDDLDEESEEGSAPGTSGEEDADDMFDDEDGSDGDMLDDEESSDASERNGFIDDEAEESEGEELDEEDEDTDQESSEGSEGEDEDEEVKDSRKPAAAKGDAQNIIRDIIDQQTVAASLSNALQKDVTKGRAVRQQQKAFDALLNVRIRLQKSLTSMNTLKVAEESEDQSEPYEAAEAAALKLWNAIDGYRSQVQPGSAKAGQKRKRTATIDTPSGEIWKNMELLETQASRNRKSRLEQWSNNVRNIRTVDNSSRKFTKTSERALTSMLDEELRDAERLIKRTRTPRSCAPAQAAQKINEDPDIYDDADFYQLLLKELVDQRAGDNGAPGAQVATVRFAAVKEAKAKRHVDTRASKGRKMRFTVHEKLQNFMAPEDRRSWEQNAIDRLFGTMFGQKMVLNEGEISDEEMGDAPVEEQGLRLFRD